MTLRIGIVLLLLATVINEASSQAKDSKSARKIIVQNVKIDDKTRISIYDGVIGADKITVLSDYAQNGNLQFVQENFDYAMDNGLTPFLSVLDREEFSKSKANDVIKSLVKKCIGADVKFTNAYMELLHSLDPKPPVVQFCRENVYYATIFLPNKWGHNMYGQLSFYTISTNNNVSSTPREEIVHTVHPKPGRIVVWPSCALQAAHPPAVNYFANLMMLRLVYTKADAEETVSEKFLMKDPEKPKLGDWTFTNADAKREIDYASHLKRSYFDSKRRGIYVLDDLYTPAELKQFRDILLETSSLRVSEYDGFALEDNDNVQWIASYDVEEFVKTPVWTRMQELLFFLTQENEWYPYDVAMNYIRPADHTRIHPDAEPHQVEYTFLLYLTENVTRTDFGETVFVEREKRKSDGIHAFTNPGGEEYEPIAAVWPKYGRVDIFRNVIEHSARPLSTSHLACRYTFACKASRSKRLSLIKQVYEKMEAIDDGTKEFAKLNRDLSTGRHDNQAKSKLSTEQLQEKFDDIKAKISKQMVDGLRDVASNL